jgi:hypothetical protein
MTRDGLRRLLWVVSLLVALAASHWLLLRYGAEWGMGAAP